MAFKLRGGSGNETKLYLFPLVEAGPVKIWCYVSADAAATVDGSGYIDGGTNGGDHSIALNMLGIGDLVLAYQVASITDTQPISDDMKAGISDISLHAVLDNTGETGVADLSDDLLGATVTYGD